MKITSALLVAAAASTITVQADSYFSNIKSLVFGSDKQVILELGPGEIMMTSESKKAYLKKRGHNFMDVTKYFESNPFSNFYAKTSNGNNKNTPVASPEYKYPESVAQKELLFDLFKEINIASLRDTITQMSSFYTRYYKSQYGLDSSNWLHDHVSDIVSELKAVYSEKEFSKLVSIEKFDHDFVQNSIILRLNGKSGSHGSSANSTIVLGAHLDSINLMLPSLLPAPGCDDDASGTAASIEVLKVYVKHLLKNRSYWPVNNIEFHFYAAEEGGLLGSQDVFYDRRAKQHALNDTVVAMLQLDQIGYATEEDDEHIGLISDFVSVKLTQFVKKLIETYLEIPYIEDKCGYACSDHASADKYGYPSAMVAESLMLKDNKYTHSSLDTIDRLNFAHIAEFVKLGLSTILELADYEDF